MRAIDMSQSDIIPEAVDPDFCGCVSCEADTGWAGHEEHTLTWGGGPGYYGTRKWHPHGRGLALLGAELELSGAGNRAWRIAYDRLGDVVAEAKPDGSLLEITSHPMTLPSFTRLFPWDMLTELRNAGAVAEPSHGGLHIHIAKAAFDDADHIFNWWRLYFTNPSQTNQIGGRRHVRSSPPSTTAMRRLAEQQAGQAAFLRAVHAASRNAITKNGRPHLRPEDRQAVTAARQKRGNPSSRYSEESGEHYEVIATRRHAETFECRFPGATLDADVYRARLQFIAGGMEYARQLPDTSSAGHTFSAFADWVAQQGRYPELNRIIQAL